MQKNNKNKTVDNVVEENNRSVWDLKKILIILSLALLFIGLLAWFFFFRQPSITTVNGNNYNQNDVNLTNTSNIVDGGQATAVVGNQNNQQNNQNEVSGQADLIISTVKTPRLFRISDEETAGLDFGNKVSGGYSIKYFTSADGKTYTSRTNTYDEDARKLKAALVSDEIFTDIVDVKWVTDNKKLITYVDRLGVKKIFLSSNDESLEKVFLPNNIETIAVSDQGKIYYMVEKNGTSEGYVLDHVTNKTQLVFTSELTQWESTWRGTNKVLVYPKNISTQQGVSYIINITEGTFAKENNAMYNMQALMSPNGLKIAYFGKENTKSIQTIFIKDLLTKEIKKVDYNTFTDKCVWSQNGTQLYCALPKKINSVDRNEPDNWYKGVTTFEDKFILIDASSGLVSEIFDPEDYGVRFDAIKLGLSQNNDFIYFTDKNSLHTWGYKINPEAQ